MNSHRNARRRSGILHSTAMMLGSSYFQMAVGLVRGVLVMRIIGPTGRGIMQLVLIAHKYLTHSHLGTLHGITKLLPGAIGREDDHAIRQIEDVGASFVTLSAVIAGGGLSVFGAFSGYGAASRSALMVGGAILVTTQVDALYRCLLRAWGTFSVIAMAGAIMALGQFVFVLAGAQLFDVTGAMFGWLLAMIVLMLYLRVAGNISVSVRLHMRPAFRLLWAGLPLAVILFSQSLLRTVDGLIVWHYFPARVHDFGIYSVAMQAATYLYRLPEVGGFIMLPRILEGLARTGNAEGVRMQVMLPTLAAATAMPVVAGGAYIVLPIIIRMVIPKFTAGIAATQALSLGSVLLALPMTSNSLLISLNRDLYVAANNGIGAAVTAGGAMWQATHGGTLRSVAIAALAGYFVASFLSLTMGLAHYCSSKLQILKQLLVCHLPLLWCLGAIKLSGSIVPQPPGGRDWAQTLIRLAIFLVISSPVLVYGNRRTGFIARIKEKFSGARDREDTSD